MGVILTYLETALPSIQNHDNLENEQAIPRTRRRCPQVTEKEKIQTIRRKKLSSKERDDQLKRNGVNPYTNIERDLFSASDAFNSLNKHSIRVYLLFLLKRKMRYKKKEGRRSVKIRGGECLNCDELNMTYKELENGPLSLNQSACKRAFDELLTKGFIEIVHQGGAYKRDKSIYKLSDNWMRWIEGASFKKTRNDVKRGYQGKYTENLKNQVVGQQQRRRRRNL